MDRNIPLPGGCKNLTDLVRVVDVDEMIFAPMTLLRAQRIARQRKAEMICIARGYGLPVFRLVDEATRRKYGTA
jgi:hypothetical protein